MDLIQLQKLHAIKRAKKHQLLDNFFLYSMTLLTCSILCSSLFWFPSLFSSIKASLFDPVPKIGSVLLSGKFIFIFGNIIIIILLVGQSKFFSSKSLPAASDVYYNEYLNQKRALQTCSTSLKKEKEKEKEISFKEYAYKSEVGKLEFKVWEEGKLEVVNEREDLDGEDLSLPTEELNKRADDFIARVNRQRMIEARLLLG